MVYAFIEKLIPDKLAAQKTTFEQYFIHNPIKSTDLVWVENLEQWSKKGQERDTLIAANIFVLGSSPTEIFLFLSTLLRQKKRIIFIEQQYDFRDEMQNQALADAFQVAARVEQDILVYGASSIKHQNLVARSTGRPLGSKSINKKLKGHHKEIVEALTLGVKITTLAKRFGVTRNTIRKYINQCIPEELRPKNKPPR